MKVYMQKARKAEVDGDMSKGVSLELEEERFKRKGVVDSGQTG